VKVNSSIHTAVTFLLKRSKNALVKALLINRLQYFFRLICFFVLIILLNNFRTFMCHIANKLFRFNKTTHDKTVDTKVITRTLIQLDSSIYDLENSLVFVKNLLKKKNSH
jgi:hypothetical protein